MSLFRSLVKNLKQQAAGRRTWTPAGVRELIDKKAFAEARQALDQLPANLQDRDAVRECLLGELFFQSRDDDAALQAFQRALRLRPALASAHYGLSLLMAEAGDLEDALRHVFYANSVDPRDAKYAAQIGYCHLKLGNHSLAEAPLRRASLLAPTDAYSWKNLGLVLLMKGKLDEAADCLSHSLSLNPTLADVEESIVSLKKRQIGKSERSDLAARDNVLEIAHRPAILSKLSETFSFERAGQLQAAIDSCEKLMLSFPDEPSYVLELHRLYMRAGDPASATDALQAHLTRHPDHLDVAATLGLARLESRDFRAAEQLLLDAVDARPDDVKLLAALADTVGKQERYVEAGKWIDRAIAIDPNSSSLRAARASNLVNTGFYEDGIELCRQMELEGLFSPMIGTAFAYLGQFTEAEAAFKRILDKSPNDPHIRFHQASMLLLQQDFERGWEGYRFRGFDNTSSFRVLPFPLWKGEPLMGKKVLVLAEQGLGDQIMFASCLPDLLALKPRELIVEAIQRIAPTLARSFPTIRVVATDQSRNVDWLTEFHDIDYYIPLGDLPGHFRRSLASFPKNACYLVPDAGRVEYWKGRLKHAGPGPYIGFSWKGGTEGTRTKIRSIEAMDFYPLAQARPATWVCLQYGAVQSYVDEARTAGFNVAFWPEAISDLDEFAALIAALDLVVTVCNTTVHYAGALGKPVWVLAPKIPEWRYGLTNRTLPWYPSSLVFRQRSAGDWQTALGVVRQELSTG